MFTNLFLNLFTWDRNHVIVSIAIAIIINNNKNSNQGEENIKSNNKIINLKIS